MKRTKQTKQTKETKDRVQPGTFLDREIYRKAKIQAMKQEIHVGVLIDKAILLYLDQVNKEG